MKQCSCEWCERTEENWNGRFKKVNGILYCEKHYQQLKKRGYLSEEKDKIYGIGISDMPNGWITKNKNNTKIYQTWADMLKRCYSKKYHEKYPTYKGCYVCEQWHRLSNFVEDVSKIPNYNEWINNDISREFSLDKDIKSDNKNKCYCLEECQFVLTKRNAEQSCRYQSWNYCSKPIYQLDDNFNIIKYFNSTRQAEIELNIPHSSISICCKGEHKQTHGYHFMYVDNYELYKKLNDYSEIDKKLEYITKK